MPQKIPKSSLMKLTDKSTVFSKKANVSSKYLLIIAFIEMVYNCVFVYSLCSTTFKMRHLQQMHYLVAKTDYFHTSVLFDDELIKKWDEQVQLSEFLYSDPNFPVLTFRGACDALQIPYEFSVDALDTTLTLGYNWENSNYWLKVGDTLFEELTKFVV